jgi:hypothetical protein
MSKNLIEKSWKIDYKVTDNTGKHNDIQCVIENCDNVPEVFVELDSRHKGLDIFINELVMWELFNNSTGGSSIESTLVIEREPSKVA